MSVSAMLARRTFLRFDKPTVGAVAVRMLFGSPTAADGDGFRFFELQNKWANVGHRVRAVAERQIFASGAAAVGDALRNLSDDARFDQIIIG